MRDPNIVWSNVQGLQSRSYDCGYCGNRVASATGYLFHHRSGAVVATIHTCPHCSEPTYFSSRGQIPGVRPGVDVGNLPKDVEVAYNEARDCIAASAFTAASMTCRKVLMHIAVNHGAAPNQSFKTYVDYLVTTGYVPPNGRGWVDHIRDKGNEMNHELTFATFAEANELIGFLEMLLKFIYEFPARVGSKVSAAP